MKCPYCGKEMELGYIQCRDGVTWDTKIRKVAALPSLRKDAVVLGSLDGIFPGKVAEAHHCRECKKIVMDYAEGWFTR